ncbi:MAG: hypothetical protein DRI22_02420 [Caldiserica bacterium]|nr:MAG: hypothetical protein DRI22_02420 [Caldisericota bacterium]
MDKGEAKEVDFSQDLLLWEKFKEKAKGKIIEKDINFLEKAYLFAKKYHEGQTRKSGEPYILHPLNVALILLL